MKSQPLDFYTQYNQFFIVDKGSSWEFDNTIWSEATTQNRLVALSNFLSVFTGSYGQIRGKFDVYADEPPLDVVAYDHVVEACIKTISGTLEIIACGFNDADYLINVSPGNYRIRICSTGLDAVIGDDGNDFYTIQLWPSEWKEAKVLKQYNNAQESG